jgi:Pyrimidine dimer DNA glycosylase (EC 3.2.2.17)/DNA-(apurinic or apyrimidinic site) lyase (EC 4.2.99.18)
LFQIVRLWSIHPKYLDVHGFLGLWREALLAQKALLGLTKGYTNHPQLIRFKCTTDPVLYVGSYLYYVYVEGLARGYHLDKSKIIKYDLTIRLPVTEGQVNYEFKHLLKKLKKETLRSTNN